MGNGEVLNCYAFNLYKTSEQDACPGGHAPKAALQYFRGFALYNLSAHQLTSNS